MSMMCQALVLVESAGNKISSHLVRKPDDEVDEQAKCITCCSMRRVKEKR